MVDRTDINDVCVVIVSHNSAHVLPHLLDSVPAAMSGLLYEIVVVDNDSTDGSADYLLTRPDVHLVRSQNVGYAAGINKGVRSGRPARSVLVLNPDTELAAGSVVRMFAALSQRGVGVVTPLVRTANGGVEQSLKREPSILRRIGLNRTGLALLTENETDPRAYTVSHSVDWAVGAVLLVSSSCYWDLGGWDESYFLYSEETDFCRRARDHGYDVRFEPDAVTVHLGGESGVTPHTHTLKAVNSVRYYSRLHSRPASYVYWFVTLMRELTWAVKRQEYTVVKALVHPGRRPPELRASATILPR